jgi:hypothetical protein
VHVTENYPAQWLCHPSRKRRKDITSSLMIQLPDDQHGHDGGEAEMDAPENRLNKSFSAWTLSV